MPTPVVDRGLAALRRRVSAVRTTSGPPLRVPGAGHARRRDDSPAGKLPLRRLIAEEPALQAELAGRARWSALLIGLFAAVAFPAWIGFDVLLEPRLAGTFAAIRLGTTVVMLAGLWFLWRRPVGLRHPQLLTTALLALAQLDIAWMVTRVGNIEPYVLGLSVALYGSGCLLAGPPRWTGWLVGVTWSALACAVLTDPSPIAPRSLATASFYLGTASLISIAAHAIRQSLSERELRARVGLLREQERAADLLRRLEQLSHEDPLTGLANRRAWDAELAAVCGAAREHGTGVAVVLLDLDHFKQLNDGHGHAGGDEALRQVAAVLRGSVRAGDVVARLGGDELGLLLPGADLAGATAVAESVRRRTLELRLDGFAPGEISVSLGVATATGGAVHPLDLVSRADAQLYRAKSTRNAVATPVADPVSRSGAR